jgi:hypothetical protein
MDRDLVERARSGGQEAFADLVARARFVRCHVQEAW